MNTATRTRLSCTLALLAGFILCGAHVQAMPSAPPGVNETGAPAFVVLGPEALGLSTSPVDMHLLPDGRVVVVAQRELAFGDGVRWETYRAADDEQPISASVIVDTDGQIYTGVGGGFARIEINEDARWRCIPAGSLPEMPGFENAALVLVTALGDQWYWYGTNGAIVTWRPGQASRMVGGLGAIERLFTLGNALYASDESSGDLYRLTGNGAVDHIGKTASLVSETVTCAIPFGPGQLLVGTSAESLKIFDGRTFRPFGRPGLLKTTRRITDLCVIGDGKFAVAIDTVGIVFFDAEGRTLQVLGRGLDHRLARVRRLVYSPEGVLWAMLNDGVARMEFPSSTSVSYFDSLLESGLSFAQPLRHAGVLWILSDGRAMRGVYDADGRLESFTDDTPPGRYLFTLTEANGHLFGSNDSGIHVYEPDGWRLILPGIVDARLGVARSTANGVFYVARGEYGVIEIAGSQYTARRIPSEGLGDSYGSQVDANGIGWIELGVSRVGRMDPNGGDPSLRILGPDDGLTDGWVELYQIEGIARFHLTNHVFRFDDSLGKFVDDSDLLARVPDLATAGGRPVTDSFGRLWYSAGGAPRVIDLSAPGESRPVDIRSVGFAPTSYTMEDDGVVWMFERRRLARMDLRITPPEPKPLHVVITSVQFSASNRQLFRPDARLKPVDYSDNSLVIHFAAPGTPFATPVTFEVLLEGAGTQWTSTGSVGSAAFNRLKEGDYVFRVRPVAPAMPSGLEASLRFTVRPPWFRTPVAWAAYVVGVIGLFASVIWFTSYLQRRENERLEKLVTERTGELHHTNAELSHQIEATTEKTAALATSEERFRQLNTELEARVKARTEELSLSNKELSWKTALFQAQADSSPDGILIVNVEGKKIFQNHRTPELWKIPPEIAVGDVDEEQIQFMMNRTRHPEQFVERVRHLYSHPDESSREEIEFKDGMVLERYSAPIIGKDGTRYGRIWAFRDITERKQSEAELEKAHRALLEVSRQAGMAEVATGVLHNVGNVLNSVNVSTTLVRETLHSSEVATLGRVAELLKEHNGDLAAYLTGDPKGRLVPNMVIQLADHLAREHATLRAEHEHLAKNVEHIKGIVAMQQNYATVSGVLEKVHLVDLLGDALQMHAVSFVRDGIEIVRDYVEFPAVLVDKHKVMQILVNLIDNAKHSLAAVDRSDRRLTVKIAPQGPDRFRVSVADNGVGISAENLTQIFSHGFTTRKDGHGFGLHSGAIAAREMGGSLRVESPGAGDGATFTLELPIAHTPSP